MEANNNKVNGESSKEFHSDSLNDAVTASGNQDEINQLQEKQIDHNKENSSISLAMEEEIIAAIKEKDCHRTKALIERYFEDPASNSDKEEEQKVWKQKKKVLNKALFFAIDSLVFDIVDYLCKLDFVNVNATCTDPHSEFGVISPLSFTCAKIFHARGEEHNLSEIIKSLAKRRDLRVNARGPNVETIGNVEQEYGDEDKIEDSERAIEKNDGSNNNNEQGHASSNEKLNNKTSKYSEYPALVLLAMADDLKSIQNLIENRPSDSEQVDINIGLSESRKDSALHFAVGNNNLPMVQYLLGHSDINPNICASVKTPLIISCCLNLIDITKALLQCPTIDVNYATEEDKATSLIMASKLGFQDQVKLLLQHPQIDVNLPSNYGDTALIWAICAKKTTVAKILLSHPKINVNHRAANGSTALTAAVTGTKRVVVVGLDDEGETEGSGGNEEREEGADGTGNEEEEQQLEEEIFVPGNSEVVALLASRPELEVNIQMLDHGNDTPLMTCIKYNDDEGALALLERDDIDLTITNDYGDIALCWAMVRHNLRVCQAIIPKSGPEINSRFWQNDINCLMLAMKWSTDMTMVHVAKCLLQNDHIESSLTLTAISTFGDTVLIWACFMNLKEIVSLILEKIKPSLEYIYHASNNGSTALLCSEGEIRASIKKKLKDYIKEREQDEAGNENKNENKKQIKPVYSQSNTTTTTGTETEAVVVDFKPRLLETPADYRRCTISFENKRGKLIKLGHKKKLFGKESWQERLFILQGEKLSYHNVNGIVESSLTDAVISNTELNTIEINENCLCSVKNANDNAYGDRYHTYKAKTDPEFNGSVGRDHCVELRVRPPASRVKDMERYEREHKDHHDVFRTFYLQASSLEEAEAWVKAINTNIQFLQDKNGTAK